MTELTREYLDKSLKKVATKEDLRPFATKEDLKDQTEELARIVNQGFQEQQDYLEKKLDVKERIEKLEKDMIQIKEALHIK